MCFPVKFATFLRTPFLQNTSGDCFSTMATIEGMEEVKIAEKRQVKYQREKMNVIMERQKKLFITILEETKELQTNRMEQKLFTDNNEQ